MATQKLTPFPSPEQAPALPERITQVQLSLLLTARSRLRQLQEQVEEYETSIKARLEAGAPVEPGDHTARLKEHFRRCVAWKDVVIRLATRLGLNGEAYTENVLAHTAPTRTVTLDVA